MHLNLVLVFSGVAISSAFAFVSVLSRQDLSECVQTCSEDVDLGRCSLTDIYCLCNDEEYRDHSLACYVNTCNDTDLRGAVYYWIHECDDLGATIPTATGH